MKRISLGLASVIGMLAACSAPTIEDGRLEGSGRAATGAPASPAPPPAARAKEAPAPPAPAGPAPVPSTAEALALARIDVEGAVHTIVITKDSGATLDGVDVSAALADESRYPLDLVTKHGFAKVAAAAAAGPSIAVARADLLPPIAEGSEQVNAAENYKDHQDETGAAGKLPFLFPKIAEPTSCNVDVARKKGDLLDYEAELCVAFGRDITSEADVAGSTIGYVLCNDLSERAIQVLLLDPDNQASGIGFTDAKSRPGFLPLGPYVVVPKDPQAFLGKITLQLRVNGEKRQDDAPKNMVWNVERLVKEALAAGTDPRFQLRGKPLALLPQGKIRKGMLLVSGTPGGVVLEAPTQQYKLLKASQYITSGAFLTGISIEDYVQEQLVKDLRASKTFLKPGDVVEAEGAFLGRQRITISGASD